MLTRLVLLATLLVTAQLRAQSATGVDAKDATRAERDVVPPQALSTPLAYPEAASGSAKVVLELTIEPDGAVVDARALSGE